MLRRLKMAFNAVLLAVMLLIFAVCFIIFGEPFRRAFKREANQLLREMSDDK